MAIYGIILQRFSEFQQKEDYKAEVITVYYPELAKKAGKSLHITHNDIEGCAKNMKFMGKLIGIIGNGTKSGDILPVLAYIGNDADKNTITFASPYITRIVKDIYEASIKRNKKGEPLLKKKWRTTDVPSLLLSYRYEYRKRKKQKSSGDCMCCSCIN